MLDKPQAVNNSNILLRNGVTTLSDYISKQ